MVFKLFNEKISKKGSKKARNEAKLKTKELMAEFLKLNPGKHITKKGGDSIGGLNWGSERIELTEEFARFIIERILEIKE